MIPWSSLWFDADLQDEFAKDHAKMREWFQSVFNGVTVGDGRGWSGNVEFVDYQPMLQLVLLELHASESYPSAVELSDAPKHEGQTVVVHDELHYVQGQLTVTHPGDAFPWRIKLDDAPIDLRTGKNDEGHQITAGTAVATPEGKLLGLLIDLQSTSPNAPLREVPNVIPASYIDALLRIQHPGVSGDLDTLLIGVAQGKELAQVELRAAFSEERVSLPAQQDPAATEAPEVVGPAPVGAVGRAGSVDEYNVHRRGGGRGAVGLEDEDDAASRFGGAGGRGAAGSRGMMGMIGGGRMRDEDSAPQEVPREMKVFTLQHLSGDDAMSVLNSLFAGSTTFSRVLSQKTVIIANGPASKLNEIEALLKTLDAEPSIDTQQSEPVTLFHAPLKASPDSPMLAGGAEPPALEMKLFRLAHMHPVSANNALVPLFPGRGSLLGGGRAMPFVPPPTFVAVPSQRALIARGLADDLKKIEALLKVLDVPEVEPPEGAEVAAEATADDDERLPPNSFSMKYQLRDAKWRDVAMELMKLRKQSGVEWFRVDTNTVDNTVTVIGSSAGLQAPSGLIQKLDPNAQLVVTDNYSPKYNAGGFAVEEWEGDVEALRLAYAEHEAKVRDRAERGRDPARYLDGRPPQKIAEELRAAVVEAFDARQKLQRAELAALEQRLASMRRTLTAREKIKEQIVQRRIEELLNPALKWDTSAKGKPPAANDANTTVIRSDWPVPFSHVSVKPTPDSPARVDVVHQSPIRSPEVSTERVYRGKTQDEWQSLFEAETDPTSKLVAALALVSLAAELPPDENIERVLDIGEEIVRSSYGDRVLAFAFDSVPPGQMTFAASQMPFAVSQPGQSASTDWRNTYLQFDGELTSRMARLPADVLARHVAQALTTGSDARAAFAFSLAKWNARTRIVDDKAAALALYEGTATLPADVDRAALSLLARLSMARVLGEKEVNELSPAIVELAGRLRQPEQEKSPINSQVRRWLLQGGPLPMGNDSQPTLRALAELALDTTARDGRPYFSDSIRGWEVSSNLNTVSPYLAAKVSQVRERIGPSLDGFVEAATTYFHDRTAPFSPADRAVAQDLAVILPLYSDGDEWGTDHTAAMLTAQLRAAYVDDPSQTVDTPIDELLPSKPWTILSQIVAINGEIPEFVGTATPKSKAVADKLATLDRLLAGEVAKDRTDDERLSLDGLLAEAPVETIRRLVANDFNPEVVGLGSQGWSNALDASSFLNPDAERFLPPGGFGGGGGFNPATAPTPKETIDPLLLLAILNDLSGTDEAQDRRIALLFQAWVQNGQLGDHIKILLDSPLQSRRHAARILREMAAKTGSRELRDRLLIVDPTIGGAAAVAEPSAPAAN